MTARHPAVSCVLVLVCALAACGPRTIEVTPAATPAPALFRSEEHHLTVALPTGWAAGEGPRLLAKPFEGLVAFNSWGEPGFWAPWVETPTAEGRSYRYDRESVLGQIPDGGAYVVLIQVWGPAAGMEPYGPEYAREDLGGLSLGTEADFWKWGRRLRLEVYRHPAMSAETAAALDALLASWRFDRVPAGDPGWAILEARGLLPPEADPLAFPLRDGRSVWQETAVRSAQAEVVEGTVAVTFTYRWDTPTVGAIPDDCPPDRCHWWRIEARPSGEVVLVQESGATLPGDD